MQTVREVKQDLQVLQVQVELRDKKVLPGILAIKASKALKEFREAQEALAYRGNQDQSEVWDNLAKMDSQGLLESKDLKAQLVQQARLGLTVSLVQQARRDLQEPVEHRVFLELKDKLEQEVHRVPKVMLVCKDFREILDSREQRDKKAAKASKALQDLPDFQVNKASEELAARLVLLEQAGSKGKVAVLVVLDSLVVQV